MPWKIDYLPEGQILSIRVTGVVSLSSWEDQLRASVEEAARHSCLRYLVDYRESDLQMTMADLYERPRVYARVGMPHKARIALIFPPLVGEKDFVEMVTRNRGYSVRVFSSPEPAVSWLTDPSPIAPSGDSKKQPSEGEHSANPLLHSETRYRDLVDSAPLGIVVVEKGIATFANRRLEEISGYPQEEILGTPFARFVHPQDAELAISRYRKAAAGEKLEDRSTLRLVRRDGSACWIEVTGKPIVWDDRPAVLYFISDISEKKQTEEALAQSQKMEAIGLLAGGIAHDFNNILQVILGYCEIIARSSGEKDTVMRGVSVISDSASRAASLTQQLLAFSRKQMIQLRALELGRLVLLSEQMLNRVLGEDISLTVIVDEEESIVSADEGQIQQVIMNLAVNARDAMAGGGTLTISLKNVEYAGGLSDVPPGRYAKLSVADTGTGMDEDTKSRIFEPFFTTKDFGRGTGLGLSMVYGIVKQANGFITVTSTPGHGATFTIHLPLVAARIAPQAAEVDDPRRGTETVLVVEDEASVRSLVRTILEKSGYTVIAARNGEAALELCENAPRRVDLLLSDLVMPGMRGDKVGAALRIRFPGMKVIYMTGYTDKEPEAAPSGTGNTEVLLKPFSAGRLLSLVRRILDG